MTLPLSQRIRARALLALVAVLAAACGSTGQSADGEEPLVPIQKDPPTSIGKFLADTDASIARWSSLTMTARTSAEQREARMLQAVLIDNTGKRLAELIHELESGPPVNRIRAAAALGFTRSVEAQSPLLAALSDPSPDVVHNALFGLAVLGRADTPLDPICKQLERSSDNQTRAQAAWALRAIVGAGGSGTEVVPISRRALIDPEPLVRAQCALVLGLVGDSDSVRAIGDLLYDQVPLVSQAAAEALWRITEKDAGQKGPVGRRLVETLDKNDSKLHSRAMEVLVKLADVNYGDDLQAWVEWARRLP